MNAFRALLSHVLEAAGTILLGQHPITMYSCDDKQLVLSGDNITLTLINEKVNVIDGIAKARAMQPYENVDLRVFTHEPMTVQTFQQQLPGVSTEHFMEPHFEQWMAELIEYRGGAEHSLYAKAFRQALLDYEMTAQIFSRLIDEYMQRKDEQFKPYLYLVNRQSIINAMSASDMSATYMADCMEVLRPYIENPAIYKPFTGIKHSQHELYGKSLRQLS